MKRSILFLCALFCVSAARCATAQTALWKVGISLIPYPQDVRLEGADFVFPREIAIVLDQAATPADRFAAEDLAERLRSEHGIAARVGAPSREPSIRLTRTAAPKTLGDQGYEFVAGRGGVTIRANGESGLFYGTRTLLQVIQAGPSGPSIRGMKISDWPDIPNRAVHYDTKHHQDKADYVKEFIRTLSDYKINVLIWEWEDKFAYRRHPEIGAPGAFTLEEMQEFTHYARRYHVQLVPLVQGLGHVSFILKWPQFGPLREIPASNWEFCPRKEGSYRLLFDLWEEAIEATPGSEYIHIGTDETYELGLGAGCGCKERAVEVGRYGLLQDFIGRSAHHLMAKGRKVISWGGEYRPNEKIRPPQGLITAEFGKNLDAARSSREAGYPAWVYDPNPGIEHLFLPYDYKLTGKKETEAPGCLVSSHATLAPAARSGLFDGMVSTSWDDSGLHNQVWMMRFVHAAEDSWSGGIPGLDEFREKYFVNYYGSQARDLKELWLLMNRGAYYYMDTFERKVWHWGEIGKTHLPDLPRGDAVEYNPYWNTQYKAMVERSRAQLPAMSRAIEICRGNRQSGVRHSYDFEVFESIANLIAHTARTYIALSDLENSIAQAHRQHFVSHEASYSAFEKAAGIVETNLKERDQVFSQLVAVWEKTRLPKGLSTPGKRFFHQQDRARHYANRRRDMTYLIYDEQRLGLEEYLKDLRVYMDWYRKTYLSSVHASALPPDQPAGAGSRMMRTCAAQPPANLVDWRLKPADALAEADNRLRDLEQTVHRAGAEGCDVLAFPEDTMGLLHWEMGNKASMKDVLPEAVARMLNRLGQAAAAHHMYLVCASDTVDGDGVYRNTAFFLGRDGKEIGRYHKVSPTVAESDRRRGESFPVFETPDLGGVGLLICYDLVMPESTRSLALGGADIVFVVTMGGAAMGDAEINRAAFRVRAVDNFIYLVVSKRGGGGMIVSPKGKILGEGNRPGDIAIADLDPFSGRDAGDALNSQTDMRARLFRERNPAAYGILTDPDPPVLEKIPATITVEEAVRIAEKTLTVGNERFDEAERLLKTGKISEATAAFEKLEREFPRTWIDRLSRERLAKIRSGPRP